MPLIMGAEALGASVYREFFDARTKLEQQVSGLVREVFSIARTTMPIYTTTDNNFSRLPSSTDRAGSHSYLIETIDEGGQTVFLLLHGDPYSMIIINHYKNQPNVTPDGQVLGELSKTTYFAWRGGGLAFVAYSLPEDKKAQLYSHDIDFRGRVTRGYGRVGTLGIIDMEVKDPGVDYRRPGYERSIDPVTNGLAVLGMLQRGAASERITLDYLPNFVPVRVVD